MNGGNLTDTAEIVRRTLREWQCATGISWELDGQSLGIDDVLSDDISLIFFSDTGQNNIDVGTFGLTTIWSTDCASDGRLYAIVDEVDIRFSKQIEWHVTSDPNSPPDTSKFDLWNTVLHELGHAHLLTHALEIGDTKVMRPLPSKTEPVRFLQQDRKSVV